MPGLSGLRNIRLFGGWRRHVRIFARVHARRCSHGAARNLEMASQQQHQRQGPDSEYNTIDEYREANSSEGSLEDEVELGDSVDGSERED